MLQTLVLIAAAAWLWRALRGSPTVSQPAPAKSQSPRLAQALEYGDRLFKDRRLLQAERAYLEVLKIDHKNGLAYSRLGATYAALKNYPDAIECWQIVCQMDPSAGHFTSLAQVMIENRNYVKAIAAIEKAIMFQPSATRYAYLGKVHLKMASPAKAVTALEKALELDPQAKYWPLLANAYSAAGRPDKAAEIKQKQVQSAARQPITGRRQQSAEA